MSFTVSMSYGAGAIPITISGTVLPEEITDSAVNITVRLPNQHGDNQYCVHIISSDKESVNVRPFLALASEAIPTIEVEALIGDFAHMIRVEAQIADGPPMSGTCPMGCAIVLEPVQ